MKERGCCLCGNECKLKRIPNTAAISNLHLDGNVITSLTPRRPAFVWMSSCGLYRWLSRAPKQGSPGCCQPDEKRFKKICIKTNVHSCFTYKNDKSWWFLRRNESLAVFFLSVLKASQMLLVSALLISHQSRIWWVPILKHERLECCWSCSADGFKASEPQPSRHIVIYFIYQAVGKSDQHERNWSHNSFYSLISAHLHQKLVKKGKWCGHRQKTTNMEVKWRTAAACRWF